MAKLIRPKVKKTEGKTDVTKRELQAFDFRLRFNMLKGDHINSESEEIQLMLTPNGQVIRLRAGSRGSPIKGSSEIAILGGPYPSPEEAEKAGQHTRQAVLIWAVRQRLGVDFGDGILRGFITDHGKRVYERKFGRPVRNDRLGIDVYESEKRFLFGSTSVGAGVAKNASAFIEQVCPQMNRPLLLTEKQILAAELYGASFFDVPFRSRFISLVTAIEALLVPTRRANVVQSFVDGAGIVNLN